MLVKNNYSKGLPVRKCSYLVIRNTAHSVTVSILLSSSSATLEHGYVFGVFDLAMRDNEETHMATMGGKAKLEVR